MDDREQRPGVKFKDADLIGIPLRVVIGERGLKEGTIEVKWRTDAAAHHVAAATAGEAILAEVEATRKAHRRPLRRAAGSPGPRRGANEPARPAPATLTWTPFVLLGLLTIATFGGPLAHLPDAPGRRRAGLAPRPSARVVDVRLSIATCLVLLAACLTLGLRPLAARRSRPSAKDGGAAESANDRRRLTRAWPASAPRGGLAFVLSAGRSRGLARRWAPRFGLIDRPGGHKGHQAPTPLGGGVAIWLTTVTDARCSGRSRSARRASGLPPSPRRSCRRALAPSGRSWPDPRPGDAHHGHGPDRRPVRAQLAAPAGRPGGAGDGPRRRRACGSRSSGRSRTRRLGGALSVLWIVGLTNAFNILDNMDGLAAGVGLIAALLFAGAQVVVGSLFVPAVLLGPGRGAGRVPGPQPLPRPAVHGGRREQLPRVHARRPDGRRHLLPLRAGRIRRSASSPRSW